MIEMIGDFGAGRDTFDGLQKATTAGAVAALLRRFDLPAEAVRFHNQMSAKTCPGPAIERMAFLAEVRTAGSEAVAGRAAAAGADAGSSATLAAFGEAVSSLRQNSLSIIAEWHVNRRPLPVSAAETEPQEEEMNANAVSVIAGAETPVTADRRALFGEGPDFTAEEKQILRPHIVDLRLGVFSDEGKFSTSLADVRRVFDELLPDELESQKSRGEPLRFVFYAHGGLVSEDAGIHPCLRTLPFWRGNNLYPIFFLLGDGTDGDDLRHHRRTDHGRAGCFFKHHRRNPGGDGRAGGPQGLVRDEAQRGTGVASGRRREHRCRHDRAILARAPRGHGNPRRRPQRGSDLPQLFPARAARCDFVPGEGGAGSSPRSGKDIALSGAPAQPICSRRN